MSEYTPKTLRALARKVCDEWGMMDWSGGQEMTAHASAWEAAIEENERLRFVIRHLLGVLPDGGALGESGEWCWNELYSAEQDMVKAARHEADAALAQEKPAGAPPADKGKGSA